MTEAQFYAALGGWLLDVTAYEAGEVVRGLENAKTAGPCLVFTPLFEGSIMSPHVSELDEDTGEATVTQPVSMRVQLTAYGSGGLEALRTIRAAQASPHGLSRQTARAIDITDVGDSTRLREWTGTSWAEKWVAELSATGYGDPITDDTDEPLEAIVVTHTLEPAGLESTYTVEA